MNKRNNDASREELFALVLSRFLAGTIREGLFSSIAGIPEDSDRDLLTGLGTTPELSAQIYSEAGWAVHYGQQARIREAAEQKRAALVKKMERGKALDALVEENRSEAEALADELLKLLEARAAIPESPLTENDRKRLEADIRAAVTEPANVVESAKLGSSKVEEVRALIKKRLGRLKRGLESEIYQRTEPLPVVVEAKRHPELGPEAAEAWLLRVAGALSDEEITEREQAILVFINHAEALSRMEVRLERFIKLVELGAPQIILEGDMKLFMKSGAAMDMFPPSDRRRKIARQKYEHVLELMDQLSQTFAADPGPAAGQDEETYRIWRESREKAARMFTEALRAADNPGIQKTIYKQRLTKMLSQPEGNEEEVAELMEAAFEIDPDYVVNDYFELLEHPRELVSYYWGWWGVRIKITALQKKIREIERMLKPVMRKKLDFLREQSKELIVEFEIPEYLNKLERLVRLRDVEKNADDIFRIIEAFQKIEDELAVPQRQRLRDAMEVFDQKIEEGTRPRISTSQRQQAERDLAAARRKQKEAAAEETFEEQLTAYQGLFKGADAYSLVFPEEALEIQHSALEGALHAAQREQYRAEEAAPDVLDGAAVERLSAQYSRVYDWVGRLELDSMPLTKKIVGIMDIIESAILELHLDYRKARAEAAAKGPVRKTPAAKPASYPFSVVFTPKAYRQVLVRYQKDESFRRKFPYILEELLTKGVKGDAKLSNWMGLWGDRFDRDSYRIYWRPEGNRIHVVGVFHKDLTREKGRLGDVYLEHIASLDPSELPVYSREETDAFVRDVVASRAELRGEGASRPELRAVSEDLIRFFRGLGNFSRDRLAPALEAPAAFADELETTALEVRAQEDIERGLEAHNHFQAILTVSRPIVVDYEISADDSDQMGSHRKEVLVELFRAARDSIVANPHIGIRIRLPETGLREAASAFQTLEHHRKDRIRHEISGGRLFLYHTNASAEKLAAAEASVTISSRPGIESQELVLGSSAYQDQTRVRYDGPEGVHMAARFLTAGLVLAADALSEKTRGQLIQYDTGRFRAQSEEALHHLAAYVADLLARHRASLISAAAA